jgi:hypothetical protein
VLVVKGTTRQFNSLFDQRVIDKDLAEDYARFSAEYLSEWRDDISSFIPRELLEACTEAGVLVRPPQAGVSYHAFADTSSGRNDSFTMSIAHREQHGGGMRVVVDLLYERVPPFSPTAAVEEITTLLRQYRCGVVVGEPSFRMYRNVLRRTGMALRGRASPANAVGCEHPELRDYIAAQFRTGMCWERYRQWEVNHVKPLSAARTLNELITLCHYSNLQPLWRGENLKKGGA